MSPNACKNALDEQMTCGLNEATTLFEPKLTLLVNVGPKGKNVLSPDFRQHEVTKISGKITVSF